MPKNSVDLRKQQKVAVDFTSVNDQLDQVIAELEEANVFLFNIDDKLLNVIAYLDNISTELTSIGDVIDTIESDLVLLNIKTDTVITALADVNTELNSITSQLNSANITLGTINTTLGSTNTKLDTVNTSLGTINTTLGTTNTKLTSIDNTLTAAWTTGGTWANGTQTTVSSSAIQIQASSASRKRLIIQNVGNANARVGITGVTNTTGKRLVPNETLILEHPYCETDAIFAIREGSTDTTILTQQTT